MAAASRPGQDAPLDHDDISHSVWFGKMNKPVLILSPHCDDAPLSLGGALLGKRLGSRVHVAVCFSVSRWIYGSKTLASVSTCTKIRNGEERSAAKEFGYRVSFLGLKEPFARPGFDALKDVFDTKKTPEGQTVWRRARDVISKEISRAKGLILAPTPCSNHIDHKIVSAIARNFQRDNPDLCLGLYEDLPYAAFLSDEAIASRISLHRGSKFWESRTIRIPHIREKVARLRIYQSQPLGPMNQHLKSHHSRTRGERVWLSPRAIQWWDTTQRNANDTSTT